LYCLNQLDRQEASRGLSVTAELFGLVINVYRLPRWNRVLLRPVYSDATQLNWTSSSVELRWRSVYSDSDPDATQLNSIVGDSWVASVTGEGVYSDATQLNSTQRPVELSCVAINGPLNTTTGPCTPKILVQNRLWCIYAISHARSTFNILHHNTSIACVINDDNNINSTY